MEVTSPTDVKLGVTLWAMEGVPRSLRLRLRRSFGRESYDCLFVGRKLIETAFAWNDAYRCHWFVRWFRLGIGRDRPVGKSI